MEQTSFRRFAPAKALLIRDVNGLILGPQENSMLTDFEILRIPETQDIFVIRKAYRKIAKEIHPDVSNESDLIKNHLLFIQINRAYRCLSR